MKHFEECKKIIDSLVDEKDNYIIFNDGKPIRQNIKDEDMLEINVDVYMDSFDICKRKRTIEEDNIIKKSSFNVYINIKKDIDLKVIYLNDEESNMNYFYEFERNIKSNITNIYIDFKYNTNILCEYSLNDLSDVKVNNFVSSDNELNEINNYYLDEASNIEINNLKINNEMVTSVSNVYLYEEKAKAQVNNSIINVCGKKQKYNFNIYHLEKKTKSELIGYGVVRNNSYLNMDTNGIISNGAKKSELYQKSKGIILDLNSIIEASPWLQIDEFDCMATHGASVGAIDDNDLFYLMSRGLDRGTSESLIINGFFNPYLSKIEDKNILDYIQNIVNIKLNK